MDIAKWRIKIDELDRRLVDLLNERARIVQEIGALKQHTNLPISEPTRETKVLENIFTANTGPLTNSELQDIYGSIIKLMRDIQTVGRPRDVAKHMTSTLHNGS